VAAGVQIGARVVKRLERYRQSTPWSKEAGGQLFGSIDSNRICVAEATGPYRGDARSRFHYQSDPHAAQRAVEACAARGLLYLGEWHTHAEDRPHASGWDHDAMDRLLAGSRLNSNSLLMLIGGRAPVPEGLAAWSASRAGTRQWRFVAGEAFPEDLSDRVPHRFGDTR
jgi:integrative and conjugative element protein (TIGR02256 family)